MYLRPLFAIAAFAAFGSTASAQTLIHHYTFGTDASDSAGSANGTLNSGATASGGVLSLSGTANVSFTQHIVPTSGAYSVALFARQNTLQSNFREWISQGVSGGPGFYIGYKAGGGIRATDSWLTTGTSFTANGIFEHIALVTDGATSSLYLNGVLSATLASGLNTTAGGDNTRFGKQFSPFNEYFQGDIADMRIYTGALSAQQAASLATTPEPGSMALLTAGALGLLSRRRRRKRTK